MSEQKHGGPAFPSFQKIEQFDEDSGKYRDSYELMGGMLLRDYFAAKALSGMVANESWVAYARGCVRGEGGSVQDAREWTAKEAYRLADAMLEVRAEREKGGA